MAQKITTFDQVIGHRNLITFLQRKIKEDDVANVVIFHGSSGIGKSSIAKLLAIEVACRYSDESLKAEYTKEVIENSHSTDSIKLFNMSEIQSKQDEIQKVRSELNSNFTKTKRKVLILDEAHNMSNEAQDALLIELENLASGVYVFICTTEIESFREALKSRGKATFRLNDLTDAEARKVANSVIDARRLTFDTTKEMIVSLVCDWANNQPRKICNLFENFEEGSVVTSRDLEIFINVSTASSVIELLKYLYGSMTLGIDYLGSIKYDESFATMLIEVCKVAMGHVSRSISQKDTLYIKEFMRDKSPEHIMRFTAEVAGLTSLRRRRVISAFMKSHVAFKRGVEPASMKDTRALDTLTLQENCKEAAVVPTMNNDAPKAMTLDELFSMSSSI